MKKGIFFLIVVLYSSISASQNINSSQQTYVSGDANNWYLNGTGNGPAIMLRQHSGLGGPMNRRGSLGWMDNNGVKYEILTWTDNNNVGIGTTNPEARLHVFGDVRFVPYGGLGSTVLNLMQSNNIDGYSFTIDNAVDGRMELRGNGDLIQTWFRGSNATLFNGSLSVSGQNVTTTDNVEQFVIRRNANTNHQLLIGRYAGYSYLQSVNQNTAFDAFCLNPNGGNIGIGTTNPTEKLAVNGNIRAKKLIVTQSGWPDYVFNKSYKLKPLSEVDQFIKNKNHLPDMPSSKDVEEKGLDIGKTQAALLKKIEELTLYVIDLQNQIKELKNKK